MNFAVRAAQRRADDAPKNLKQSSGTTQKKVETPPTKPFGTVLEDISNDYGKAVAEAVYHRFPNIELGTPLTVRDISFVGSVAQSFHDTYQNIQEQYGEAGARAFQEVFGQPLSLSEAETREASYLALAPSDMQYRIVRRNAEMYQVLDQTLARLATLSVTERRLFIEQHRSPTVRFSKEEDPYGAKTLLHEMIRQVLHFLEPYWALLEHMLPEEIKSLQIPLRLADAIQESDPNVNALRENFQLFNTKVAEYRTLLTQQSECKSILDTYEGDTDEESISTDVPDSSLSHVRETVVESANSESEGWVSLSATQIREEEAKERLALARARLDLTKADIAFAREELLKINQKIETFFETIPAKISPSLVQTYGAYQAVAAGVLPVSCLSRELCQEVNKLARLTIGGSHFSFSNQHLLREAKTVAMLTTDIGLLQEWDLLDIDPLYNDIHLFHEGSYNVEQTVLQSLEDIRNNYSAPYVIKHYFGSNDKQVQAIKFLEARRQAVLDEEVNTPVFDHASKELLRALKITEIDAHALTVRYLIGKKTSIGNNTFYLGGENDLTKARDEVAKLETLIQDAQESLHLYQQEIQGYRQRLDSLPQHKDPDLLVEIAEILVKEPYTKVSLQQAIAANKRYILGCQEMITESKEAQKIWDSIIQYSEKNPSKTKSFLTVRGVMNQLAVNQEERDQTEQERNRSEYYGYRSIPFSELMAKPEESPVAEDSLDTNVDDDPLAQSVGSVTSDDSAGENSVFHSVYSSLSSSTLSEGSQVSGLTDDTED